ncbi:MAG TPA: hypothetical protein VJS64_01520 [Pyrinomonadaceae bacterium]|nr:hypothetical protein [Pyrinomonadaceae bacterium]
MSSVPVHQLPLAPLGAGDLIDRAVRLYRRHLFTLIRIAAPPVIVSTIGSVLCTISWRRLFSTDSGSMLAAYVLTLIAGILLFIAGHIFSLLVMGGAARNLVTHLLWNHPVTVRTTYAAVRSRFWSLLLASIVMLLWAVLSLFVAFFGFYMVMVVIGIGSLISAQVLPAWLSVVIAVVGFVAGGVVSLWLFFFFVGRVAYVPQAMLIEGKPVFDSISRSFSLARGNVRRLMAMTIFITFATYSALMILVIPLGWYGYLNGIDPSPWNAANWPAWYAIGYSVMEPLSSIVLAPVWMLGLSLLYVDERVRHEGYDIELMAAQHLGRMPDINVTSPFAPAIVQSPGAVPATSYASTGSVLGLRR